MGALTVKERFDKHVLPEPNTGCWLWMGEPTAGGYGRILIDGRARRAHRVAWELEHGIAPPHDRFVCHRCDNRICVNPTHLFLGTNGDNVKDMMNKGRQCRGPARRESQRHRFKLTEDQVREIRITHAAGRTTKELAAAFDLHREYVRQIIRRKHWADVL